MNIKRWLPFWRKKDVPFLPEEEMFAARSHRFQLVLNAWSKLQEAMADIEIAYYHQNLINMQSLRVSYTRIAMQVFQCIRQLEELAPGKYPSLEIQFKKIQHEIDTCIILKGIDISQSPSILPLSATDEAYNGLADPTLVSLGELAILLPDAVPNTQLITAAGCAQFFAHNKLQAEISRKIQSVGGVTPSTVLELSKTVQKLITSASIPESILEPLKKAIIELCASSSTSHLLFRGRVWPMESSEDEGGMTLWGPLVAINTSNTVDTTIVNDTVTSDTNTSDSTDTNDTDINNTDINDANTNDTSDKYSERLHTDVITALLTTFSLKYSPQALAYRRFRGLRDAGTSMCIGIFALNHPIAGGIAYTSNPIAAKDPSVHVYAAHGLPENTEDGKHPVDTLHVCKKTACLVRLRKIFDEAHPIISDATASAVASLALTVAENFNEPQEIDWIISQHGTPKLLHVRPLKQIQQSVDSDLFDEYRSLSEPIFLSGTMASPGTIVGPAYWVRSESDIASFPDGAILLLENDDDVWGLFLDRAAGVLVEKGTFSSQIYALAREFSKPAMFGLKGLADHIVTGEIISFSAELGLVFKGVEPLLAEHQTKACNFMLDSPVGDALRCFATHIIPLTINAGDDSIKATDCTTFHDIGHFCHEMAVGEMFRFGSQQKFSASRVKQLKSDVAKQFWVVNLDTAFPSEGTDNFIHIDNLKCPPMQVLWHGMNAIPWSGPPPVDAKGFMSVLFEATANPNLDPASSSTFFTEKNYFMVSKRYCSLHSRFGFHFVAVESSMSERDSENFVIFHLSGGAADIDRRIKRVNFAAEILSRFGFSCTIVQDSLTAKAEGFDKEDTTTLLLIAGYMVIHTRQLDMIMNDTKQCSQKQEQMIAECTSIIQAFQQEFLTPATSEKNVVKIEKKH